MAVYPSEPEKETVLAISTLRWRKRLTGRLSSLKQRERAHRNCGQKYCVKSLRQIMPPRCLGRCYHKSASPSSMKRISTVTKSPSLSTAVTTRPLFSTPGFLTSTCTGWQTKETKASTSIQPKFLSNEHDGISCALGTREQISSSLWQSCYGILAVGNHMWDSFATRMVILFINGYLFVITVANCSGRKDFGRSVYRPTDREFPSGAMEFKRRDGVSERPRTW